MELEEILRRKFYREQLERQGGPDIPTLISCEGMTDSEKTDFINFIYGRLKEREAQNEALHARLDARMDRFGKLQATLDAISTQLTESNKMKEALQKGFDNMHAQLEQMKSELVKTQKELRKSQREAKKYRELYEVLRDEKFVSKSQKSKQDKEKGRDDDKDDWDGTPESGNTSSAEPNIESASVETEKPSMECNAEKEPEYRPYRLGMKYETMHADGTRKAYIWCLVNKAAKIVIFFYDNGSRGRKVLTDFIGDAEIAALQSDAYNVYKYLDSELTEVEHVCCMAHVRARFQKALEQGKDERARFFFDRINELYKKEDFYKKNGYPPDKIREARHDARTTGLITEMRMELTRLLTTEDPKSDLLTNALNYLYNSWKQVMAWRNDGRYTIDNSEAERNIRTMTIERSNSKSFGSNEGVESSAVYHTIIATCRAQAISVCDYLKKFFTACVNGRTDYENLTPMMLCQPVK